MNTRRDQRELRLLLQAGDHAAFVARLEPLCQKLVNRTVAPSIETDDLMQEARLGALKAARAWSADRGANPLTYAVHIIQNHLWRIAQYDNAAKRRGALDAIHLDSPIGDTDRTVADTAVCPRPGPYEQAEVRERLTSLLSDITDLPEAVRVRFIAYLDDGRRAPTFMRVINAKLTGSDLEQLVIYLPRRHTLRTPEEAMRRAERTKPGAVAITATKRKLIDGRERAPQGRPTADGRLGKPVWRVDMITLAASPAAAAA